MQKNGIEIRKKNGVEIRCGLGGEDAQTHRHTHRHTARDDRKSPPLTPNGPFTSHKVGIVDLELNNRNQTLPHHVITKWTKFHI